MSGNSSRTLKLIFAGDNKGAVKSVDGLGKSLGGLNGSLGGVGAGLAGIFSVGAVTAFGAKAVSVWSAQAGAVAKLRRLTGASAEDASALAFNAQQAGIDATKAATGFQFLAKNISNGKVAAKGIVTKDAEGRLLSFQQILGNVSDKFKETDNAADRTRLVLDLFGRGGADMGKILALGSDELEHQRAEMKALGLSFDEDGLAKFQKFIAAQRDMQAAATGLELQLGAKLAPAMTFVATETAKAAEWFNKIPGPVQVGTEAVVGLTAASVALATAVGFLGPAIGRTAGYLGLKKAATDAATESDIELAVADLSAAEAEAALAAAWAAGTPVAEGAAAARGSLAAATEAEAAASAEAATASIGLTSALGPVAIALAGVYGIYKGIQQARHDKPLLSKLDIQLSPELLGQTSKELAHVAAAMNALNPAGFKGQDLSVLKAMRDAIDETGGKSLPALNSAIHDGEKAADRAAAREKKYADSQDDTAAALSRKERALRKVERAEAAQNKKVQEAIDKAIAERDAQQAVADAHQQTIDDTAELATAQQAAAGNSDEYRSALDGVASAEKDEVVAKADVLSATQDLNDARVEARKRLEDLADAEVQAAQKTRDARLALMEAEQAARSVLNDPASTPLEKAKAQTELADAKGDVIIADHEQAKAAAESLAAQRAGIEGDKGVVDAKHRVADAEDKVRESIGKVAEAQAAARKVLHDAADEVQADSKKVQTDKADEAGAWFNLAKLTTDATAAALIYYALLKQMGADPVLAQLIAAGLNGANSGLLNPVGQGELPNRPQGGPHAPNKPGRARLAPVVNIHVNGQPTQSSIRASTAAAKKTLNDLASTWG